MRSSSLRSVLVSLAAVATAAAFAAPAAATSYFNVTSVGMNRVGGQDALYGTIYNAGLTNGQATVYVGQAALTGKVNGTGSSFTLPTWCVDIFETLKADKFYNVPLKQLDLNNPHPDPTRVQLNTVITFLTNIDTQTKGTLLTGAKAAAAAQLGVWEILNETSSTYNLTSGSFYAAGGTLGTGNTSAMALANTWLGNLTNGTWTKPKTGLGLVMLDPKDAHNQEQVFVASMSAGLGATSAVPEAATWMTMIAGFGVVGVSLRRRRRVAATA
jgi:hypothetical protein